MAIQVGADSEAGKATWPDIFIPCSLTGTQNKLRGFDQRGKVFFQISTAGLN